jgi:autotransporter adhesin
MNKVYKSVWNANAGTYVAAAETAKSRTKRKSTTKALVPAMLLAGVAGVAGTGDAFAAGILTGNDGSCSKGLSSDPNVKTVGDCSFVYSDSPVYNHIGLTPKGTMALNSDGISLNGGIFATGGLTVMGGASIAGGLDMRGSGIHNLAYGVQDNDAVNLAQLRGITRVFSAGSIVSKDGTIYQPTYIFDNTNYRDVAAAFDLIESRIKYFHVNSTAARSNATGAEAISIGPAANASGGNSIVVGQNGLATGTGSIAIGQQASALMSNSVVLGANSTDGRSNVVSVGRKDGERQIINVAQGSAGTDAVNVDQLAAAIKSVPGFDSVQYDTTTHNKVTLGGNGAKSTVTLANVADGVANNDAVNVQQLKALGALIDSSGTVTGAFVAYDNSAKTKVTLGGTGATTAVGLTNVAAGQLSSSSKDAVNGSQLYGTATTVAAALGGGAAVGADGKLTKPAYTLDGNTYTDVGAALTAVNAKTSTGSTDGVKYDTAAHDKVTFGGAGHDPVTLTNVAAGQVTSSTKDAVNGSQLYGTASSVAAALGGGAAVGADGKLLAPAYTLDGTTYNNVGSALNAMGEAIDGIGGTITNTTKYIKVVSASGSAMASGGDSVAIGGGAYANKQSWRTCP